MAGQEDLPITPYFEETIIGWATESSSGELASAAKNLIKKFNDTFGNARRSIEREPYQIMLFRGTNKMRLRYDALTWFDYILPHQLRSKGDCAGHGSAYVSACLTRKHDNDGAQRFTNKATRFSAEEIMNLTCVKSSCTCKKLHTPTACMSDIEVINGGTIRCGQFFDPKTCMDTLDIVNEKFVLHSRPESTRGIVLLPISHTSNEIFVTMESTWKAIFEVEERLRATLLHFPGGDKIAFPIESVYFNFGSWTTAMSKNKLLKTAHAHVHALLTPETIAALDENGLRHPDTKAFIKRYALNLTGCHRDPVDYEYEDAITLQSSRILFYHIRETEKSIGQIKKSIERLEKNMVKEDTMNTLMRKLFAEFSERKKSEPSSPSTQSDDMHQSNPSNVTSNNNRSDLSSEEKTNTISCSQAPPSTLNSEASRKRPKRKNKKKRYDSTFATTTSKTNICVRVYRYFFFPIIVSIFFYCYLSI